MDSSSQLHAEIRDRLGVLPNFFRLAHEDPRIAENLWAFAKFGYLDNPLPARFKERLFVALSRFCHERYCLARHVGFLMGLGNPSGDARAATESVEQTVALLSRPLPTGDALDQAIERMRVSQVQTAEVPAPDTPMEEAVFDCAAHVFSQTADAQRCHEALSRLFDPVTFQHLLVFLAFVRTAHFWTVVHPELEIESDMAELLAIHDSLADCVLTRSTPVGETLQALVAERESLQQERRLRAELERTNAELREERERLQVTLSSIGDAVISTDTNGCIVNINSIAEELTGWRQEDAIGEMLDDTFRIINETTREPLPGPGRAALKEGLAHSRSSQTLLIARDGTERPIDYSVAPMRGKAGDISGCVLIFRDVSERREKHESAERLAAIVESSDDAIVSKSLDGIIRTWNSGAERLFGYKAREAIGQHITMLIPPERVAEEDMIISRIKAGGRVDHFDTVRVRRDGSTVEVSLAISPVKDLDGRVIGASKVARDITDRRKAEEALRKLAEASAQADERKDRFLAVLAHELRNPLSPMRSCIQILKQSPATEDSEALAIMDRQLSRMVRLIDDLLDISRISSGKLKLRKSTTSLSKVLEAAIESVQPAAARKDLDIELKGATESLPLHADGERLTQVFANLLTNAVKYSRSGGTVTMVVNDDGDHVQVDVVDLGAGIPPDQLETIFDMFRQVEGGEHDAMGLGIGLSMARELVELHEGRITAHSEGPGTGATFTVTLPRTAPQPAAPAPRSRQDENEGEESPSGVKVLVVDDSHDSANALAMLLDLRGCDVRTEFNGKDAIRTAEKFAPALVFLDIGMPGMSGLETAEHIRGADWGREMMLVALSGWGQAKDREKTRDAGFDDHLLKPATLEAIDTVLSQAAAR